MERREKEREEGEIRSKKMEGGKKEETEVERHAFGRANKVETEPA